MMMIACMHGYLPIASLFLQLTFSEDDDDDYNEVFTKDDHLRRLTKVYFQRSDIDVSLASSSGYTSLITACYKNQVRFYQLNMHILHHRIWIGTLTFTSLTKYPPKVGIAQLLLARDDVEPNWVSDEGDSLVMTCCVRGYTEV